MFNKGKLYNDIITMKSQYIIHTRYGVVATVNMMTVSFCAIAD